MPIAGQRDSEETRRTLEQWLAERVEGASGLEVTSLDIPQSSGFSNETFLFDARWREAGVETTRALVLRAQPQEYGLFPEIDILRQQYRTMELLRAHTDVPVPEVLFAESDESVLGQPFYVMGRLEGRVPGDSPPYTAEGFVMDLTPTERRALSESGLEAMCRIHTVDWQKFGFEHLDRPAFGAPGPAQLKGYMAHYHDWALEGGSNRVLDPARAYLDANWPDDGEHLDLTWGDARIGNQMFDGTRCIAVFDWEMSAIANAESDLGWWLFMQRFHSEGMGHPLPEGLLDRAETIAFWEERVGRRAEHVDFYEILGGYHFGLVMVMLTRNMIRLNPDGFPADFAEIHPGAAVLTRLLEGQGS